VDLPRARSSTACGHDGQSACRNSRNHFEIACGSSEIHQRLATLAQAGDSGRVAPAIHHHFAGQILPLFDTRTTTFPTARLMLHRGYERGDERAALELGGTYDPRVLKRLKVPGTHPLADAIQARDWYIRAAELGSVDAIYRLNELDLQTH